MDKIASFGITASWDINKGDARTIMQNELRDKFQFFKSLVEIDLMFGDNQQFINQIKEELFANKVYVYTTTGEIIELPKGSTIIDFAYRIHTDIGNTAVGAFVNDEYVPVTYKLKNKDRVRIITDDLSFGPRIEWLDSVVTSCAKRRIKEFYHKKR
jgi:GTP pyrophosphokinase